MKPRKSLRDNRTRVGLEPTTYGLKVRSGPPKPDDSPTAARLFAGTVKGTRK